MRDDLLKEQLMDYAHSGAEAAFQPGADAIHRRARRHYRRVAALTVAGLLVVAGVGASLALGRDGGTPTVDQPPPISSPAPVPSAGRLPGTFADGGGGQVTLRSSTSGKVVRKLVGSPASGPQNYALGISPDRRTVFFSQEGLELCSQAGIFRVPTGGGTPVRVVAGENATGQIKFSADGARLAYAAAPCPYTAQPVDLVVRDASGRLVRRWPGASAGLDLRADHPTLSPDGRLLAVPVFDQLTSLGVRVLDVARDRSIADGRLIRASQPRCQLVQAEFHPRTGQLAVFERCIAQDPQSETPPRFQLRYVDPGTGRVQARSFAFDDHTGADLHVSNMDFDQSGRHLLYMVTSADPVDSQEPRPATGTWRYNSGDQPVRIGDDRQSEGGERVTSYFPSW